MVQIIKTKENMIIKAEECSITYQGQMMKALSWLLPFEWHSGNELVYRKGKGVPLPEWIRGEKKEEEVLNIIDTFLQIQGEMEPYLMDEEKLVYDPEWIFWDPVSEKLQFAYVPWDFQTGVQTSFIKRFAKMLWNAGINQKWQNEKLILMLYRMQIAVKHDQNQPQMWSQWIEGEKRRIKERDAIKEQALDILTEEDPGKPKRVWFRVLKEKFPIAIR